MVIQRYNQVLPMSMFNQLSDELRYWELRNYSNDKSERFWGIKERDVNYSVLMNVQSYIKLKIQRDLGYKITNFVSYHINAMTANQRGSKFHKDFRTHDNRYTFVLYTSDDWNTQWGGETVIYNEELCDYEYSPYLPNCGVVFPSHWDHYGAAPNSYATKLRTTVAFRYEVCYNSPIVTN